MKKISGQQVNRGKTFIFFSKSTTKNIKLEIKEALGVLEIMHYEKVFGLPCLNI